MTYWSPLCCSASRSARRSVKPMHQASCVVVAQHDHDEQGFEHGTSGVADVEGKRKIGASLRRVVFDLRSQSAIPALPVSYPISTTSPRFGHRCGTGADCVARRHGRQLSATKFASTRSDFPAGDGPAGTPGRTIARVSEWAPRGERREPAQLGVSAADTSDRDPNPPVLPRHFNLRSRGSSLLQTDRS